MRIYYFGELVEVDGQKVQKETHETEIQTTFHFDEAEQPKKVGMPSLGEILEELDLYTDVYRPAQKVLQ